MALTEVKDINLNIDTKQQFSINGDATKIVEIDTQDLGIVTRLSESVKKMSDIQERWNKLAEKSTAISKMKDEEITLDEVAEFSDQFADLELEMRAIVDDIFDCEGMCDTILGNTSIFSLKDGEFKYNIIIDKFTSLYEKAIKSEVAKIDRNKVSKKTSKYIRNA